MISAKRALIKLAVIGTLATGVITMPAVASAAPDNCASYGQWTSNNASYKNPGEDNANMTPAFLANYYGNQNTGVRQQDLRHNYLESGGHC